MLWQSYAFWSEAWEMTDEGRAAVMRFLKFNFVGIKEDEIKSVSNVKIETGCGKR